ncbi:hypothetical protein K435DRAFT_876554 [Dendrothele bispora CBS 962.96]|uniref:Uncharacterized protein n=1 Tax=Dendrothele bispora (strain CBS 962.96) TaxID=1314807 RepID=A0A4S8KRT2_DENBC|nr:hypothetical protein K435DRAFT_876554 [Dendrothele bispora CBS 962.96]
MSETFKIYADQVWDFVEELPGYRNYNEGSGERSWERALFAVEEWLKTIKVPVTVYVASYGVIGGVKDEIEREKWSDLGVRRCFPDARVVHLDTGHFTILSNETIIQDLQLGERPSTDIQAVYYPKQDIPVNRDNMDTVIPIELELEAPCLWRNSAAHSTVLTVADLAKTLVLNVPLHNFLFNYDRLIYF